MSENRSQKSENETIPTNYARADELPDGQYAIVEIMGHVTFVGRADEVQRFGTAMLQIEPLFNGRLLEPVLHGGQSIYRFTPVSKAVAWEKQARNEWQLCPAVRARLAPLSLPGFERPFDDDSDDVVNLAEFQDDQEEYDDAVSDAF